MTLCCVVQEDVEDPNSARRNKVKETVARVPAGFDQLLRQGALRAHRRIISRGNRKEVITVGRSAQGWPQEGVEF